MLIKDGPGVHRRNNADNIVFWKVTCQFCYNHIVWQKYKNNEVPNVQHINSKLDLSA